MNLVEHPWLPLIAGGISATWSMRDVFAHADTIEAIRLPDPVQTAAAHRLLIAIDSAAHDAGLTPTQWLDAHAERFDLFDPEQPFAQNPEMHRHPEGWKPAVALCLSAAGDQSVLIDHRHSAAGITLPPAAAAAELLARNTFSPGGIQPFPAAPYGPNAKNGKRSVLTGRAFVWIEGRTLAETLEANRVSGGTFHFGWPPEWKPGDPQRCDGPIAALTWPSRSLILDSDAGRVTRVMVANGAVFDDATPEVLPHILWRPATDADPATPIGVSTSALTWLRTLEVWGNDAVGILATAAKLPAETKRHHTLHVAGLATFRSRIDGPIEATLAVPQVDDETVAALCAQTRALAPTLNRRVTVALDRTGTVLDAEWVQHYVDSALIGLRFDMAEHVNQVITGRRPFTEDIPAALLDTRLQPTVQHLRNIGHHRAAAYLAAATGDAISTPPQPNPPLPPRRRPTATTAAGTFVTTVLASRHRHDRTLLNAFIDWTPGTISQPVAAATADAPDDTWEVWAQVGRLICTHPNHDGPAISPTRWLQQIRDVATAPRWEALCATLNSAPPQTQRPAWAALIEELTGWHHPDTRRATASRWTTDNIDQTA